MIGILLRQSPFSTRAPSRSKRPYLKGYVAFYAGDYKTALAELSKANPNDPFIQCMIGHFALVEELPTHPRLNTASASLLLAAATKSISLDKVSH